MEPLPETVQALQEFAKFGDNTISVILAHISAEVEQLVPEIVGLSLSLEHDDLTFTMTATSGPEPEPEAIQSSTGRPSGGAVPTAKRQTDRPGDEKRQHMRARATLSAGVESTLSLPILGEGQVIARVDLYASAANAFEGRHEELAEACGAWAGGAAKNADLGFTTRAEAARTADRLHAEDVRNQGVGALMSWWGVSADEADRLLRETAGRVGISDAQMARAITELLLTQPPRISGRRSGQPSAG